MCNSISKSQQIFLVRPDHFLVITLPHIWASWICLRTALLQPLKAKRLLFHPYPDILYPVEKGIDNLFLQNSKLLPARVLNSLLEDHFSTQYPRVVTAADASQSGWTANIEVYSESLDWLFSIRLPYCTRIFRIELLAVLFVLSNQQHRFILRNLHDVDNRLLLTFRVQHF